MMNIISCLFLLFGVGTLVSSVFYIRKLPNIWMASDTRLKVGRIFLGSVTGVFLGLLLFFFGENLDPIKLDWIGVFFLLFGGFGLFLYALTLKTRSNFGEIDHFLGVHYIWFAVFLCLLALCLLWFGLNFYPE